MNTKLSTVYGGCDKYSSINSLLCRKYDRGGLFHIITVFFVCQHGAESKGSALPSSTEFSGIYPVEHEDLC